MKVQDEGVDSMKKKEVKHKENNNSRLPCRGCTRQCKNYDRCDGKPWRLVSALAK